MKNSILLFCACIFTSLLSGQVITENFDSGMPQGWYGETSAGFDWVIENGGKIDLFKQSEGDESLSLITEQYDLSQYTRLEIDVAGFNLSFVSSSVPELHIGHFHPNSDCCFEPIHTVYVPNTAYETLTIDIASVNLNTALVFKLEGDKSHILNLDNFKLYNDKFENNRAAAVENLHLEPRVSAEPGFDVSFWISPKLEADGDLLPNLSSIDFINLNDNKLAYSFENPSPGENYMPVIDIEGDAGYYRFEVYGVNEAGNGYSRFTKNYWLGLDRPGAVTNLTAAKSGDDVLLEWTAPTVGANSAQQGGSYFDNIVQSYTIVRSDGKQFVIPGNETSFTDILDIQGSISYTLIPENPSGRGTEATSNIVYRVEADYLYYEDFYVDVVERPDETLDYDYKWTTQSTTPQAFWSHFFSNFAGNDEGEMAYLWGGNNSPNTVRAVSPEINTTGFPAISIEFNHSVDFPANPNFSMVLETTSDGGVTWQEAARWQETNSITEHVVKTIGNDDVGAKNFQFAISVHGDASYANFGRYDNFRVYYQPSIDLIAQEADMTTREEPGTEIALFGVVENGSTQVVSGTANCVVEQRYGNEVLSTFTMEVEDLGIGEVRTIDFGKWTGQEGEYIVKINFENPEDQEVNNNSYSHQLDILQLVDKDYVLIEEFTGTWCSYCPGAALGIDDLITEGQPVLAVAYHRNDDYETPTTQEKMDLYNVLGFPTVVFDGQINSAGGNVSLSIANTYRPFVNQLKEVKVPVSVSFYGSEVKGQNYEAWLDITAPSKIENPNYVLRMALIEDGIAEEWQGLDVLDLVEKAYFEAPLDLLDNGVDRKFIKLPIPMGMVLENSHAVAWVQSTETNEVFNATTISLTETMTGTENLSAGTLKVYPNPFGEAIRVESDCESCSYNIYAPNGEQIYKNIVVNYGRKINLSELPKGIYLLEEITISTGEKNFQKIIKL